ncbi:MAG: hypothetical protein U5N86_08145 [Planctomycetota bacterium]|nr:hypothetical protein [Planctomycetota bacterium]
MKLTAIVLATLTLVPFTFHNPALANYEGGSIPGSSYERGLDASGEFSGFEQGSDMVIEGAEIQAGKQGRDAPDNSNDNSIGVLCVEPVHRPVHMVERKGGRRGRRGFTRSDGDFDNGDNCRASCIGGVMGKLFYFSDLGLASMLLFSLLIGLYCRKTA